MTLTPLTEKGLVAEQLVAPYVRWKHFDRVLRRMEEIHEMTQHARQVEARAHYARELELLPKTLESILETWSAREREIEKSRRPHEVARVLRAHKVSA